MAFFLHNSARDAVVACYPSPAGATESELSLETWSTGVGASALAAELEPDVEALLVRRRAGDVPAGARSTPATGSSAWSGCTGAASTAAARRGRRSTGSSTSCTGRGTGTDVMSTLSFACTGARPEPYAAGPSLQLDLRVDDGTGRRVHSHRAAHPDPDRAARPHATPPAETARLADLFGEPPRWGETLNPLQLATVADHGAGVHRVDDGRR